LKLQTRMSSKKRQKKTGISDYRKSIAPFRSKFEKSIAFNLEAIGCGYKYEPIRIPYELKSKYVPDFVLPNGIIIEAKGRLLAKDARKHRAVQKQHPNLDIRFVFMSLSTKVENSRFTHQEWATKYGFQFYEKIIPEIWINEKINNGSFHVHESIERYLSEYR
jgi:hypothetical protein